MVTPRDLQKMYKQGKNVSKILREAKDSLHNDEEIIEVTYDILTGQYTDLMDIPLVAKLWGEFNAELGGYIQQLGEITSLMEVGVGEATTMAGVLEVTGDDMNVFASDISWSRVAYADQWLWKHKFENVHLHTASMFNLPFPSSCVDVVYTAHAIEPNGSNERPILQELYRVAKQYLVLAEPAFDLAHADARQRMVEHGYCISLYEQIKLLGYKVVEHRLMDVQKNNMNPAAITIIEKNSNVLTELHYVCPKYKTEMYKIGEAYYSPEALAVYPIVGGIPCLKSTDAIVASKYPEWMQHDNDLYSS